MKRPRMFPHEAAVMEAIIRIGGLSCCIDMTDVSGYAPKTVNKAIYRLTKAGAIERVFHGRFRLTERGKIALAVWQGQQQQQRRAMPAIKQREPSVNSTGPSDQIMPNA